ncbi:CRISPR-associated protein, Csm2 family [Methanocaldococcus sp. FS406-22]|uniref:type III-A CRISPR-associated protein Csm2 n=1 Tax=Methanocaldococcus sp. (strain FS406-22) TaxID=644281 RepID=UPI0001BF4352|nr:type III-A CRISPR-associated protein Csm2 [Methanocaldococcus sp. FS406-22]ADC69272.1 CRISPR-associated protein, Csm2 family [Methanocaldococcus sp. FS406-22]
MSNIGKCILTDEKIDTILNINSENANEVIEIAEDLAKKLEEIPSSKMRDFYDYVLRIDETGDWYKELVLLKPKLAYNFGKETNRRKKEALEKLAGTFSKIIDEINNDKDKFKNFKTFFEALVAYHKIHAKSQ